MRAVILAAGQGARLLPLTENYPKPLTCILGRPLLESTIQTLKQAGVKEILIVTGYLSHTIEEYFGDGSKLQVKLRYAYNPAHDQENGVSLKVAQKLLEKDEVFLLLMSDHFIDVNIVRKALQNFERKPLLCVDRRPLHRPQMEDATRVFVNSKGYITNIGKNIPQWNGIDTGVFLLDGCVFDVMEQFEGQGYNVTVSDCMKKLIESGRPLWACDVSGLFWLDIDTPDDLLLAESILREMNRCRENGTA